MSFYLGEGINSTNIMHISSTIRTVEEMREGPYTDSVFHSAKQFVTYEIHDITLGSPFLFWLSGNDRYQSTAYPLSSTGFDRKYAEEVTGYYLLNDDYTLSPYSVYWFASDFSAIALEKGGAAITPIGPYRLSRDVSGNTIPAIDPGYRKVLVLKNLDIPPTNSITINSSTFNVSGFDLYNMKYIHGGLSLNTHASTIEVPGLGVSLIDSSQLSGPVSITANPSGAEIKRGNDKVFSSNFSSDINESIFNKSILEEMTPVAVNVTINTPFSSNVVLKGLNQGTQLNFNMYHLDNAWRYGVSFSCLDGNYFYHMESFVVSDYKYHARLIYSEATKRLTIEPLITYPFSQKSVTFYFQVYQTGYVNQD